MLIELRIKEKLMFGKRNKINKEKEKRRRFVELTGRMSFRRTLFNVPLFFWKNKRRKSKLKTNAHGKDFRLTRAMTIK